jgi:hypothetical protein
LKFFPLATPLEASYLTGFTAKLYLKTNAFSGCDRLQLLIALLFLWSKNNDSKPHRSCFIESQRWGKSAE